MFLFFGFIISTGLPIPKLIFFKRVEKKETQIYSTKQFMIQSVKEMPRIETCSQCLLKTEKMSPSSGQLTDRYIHQISRHPFARNRDDAESGW